MSAVSVSLGAVRAIASGITRALRSLAPSGALAIGECARAWPQTSPWFGGVHPLLRHRLPTSPFPTPFPALQPWLRRALHAWTLLSQTRQPHVPKRAPLSPTKSGPNARVREAFRNCLRSETAFTPEAPKAPPSAPAALAPSPAAARRPSAWGRRA
eukprot:1539315-Prymnesium_polylepis.1